MEVVWSKPQVCGWYIYIYISQFPAGSPRWMPSGQGALFLCSSFPGHSMTSPLENSGCVKAVLEFPVQKALDM